MEETQNQTGDNNTNTNTNIFDKYKDRGLSGLANLGNTCFINSSMQVLSHTYELNLFLDKQTYKKKLKNKHESALLLEWDNLRKILWNENCTVKPGKFVQTIQKLAQIKGAELFTGYSQNDLPEFLIFVIDAFHNSLMREVNMSITGTIETKKDKIAVICFEMIKTMFSKEYSEIWNLFYGIMVSQITSIETNEEISLKPEPFCTISLPIPQTKSPTLEDCFDLHIVSETLDGDNAVYNERIQKKENVTKKIMFWSFPNILIIDLKRFNSQNKKNQILVSFPLDNLDLSKYVVGYKKESYVYELYGICNHSGGAMGGHYTAFIKNANGKWYLCNDTSVQEVPVASLISPKAYCFFYRKKTIN
jgi:ubiquitin C-terminal hydrolase